MEKEDIKEICEKVGCDSISQIEVNHDIWKDIDDQVPEDYPWGWCDEERWNAFIAKHPGEYWFEWDEMLYENVDLFIQEDAIRIKS